MSARRVFAGSHGASHLRAELGGARTQFAALCAAFGAAVVTVTSGDYDNWLGVPINWQLIGSDIVVTVTMVTKYLSNWKSKS